MKEAEQAAAAATYTSLQGAANGAAAAAGQLVADQTATDPVVDTSETPSNGGTSSPAPPDPRSAGA
jgi:hypothetical protein